MGKQRHGSAVSTISQSLHIVNVEMSVWTNVTRYYDSHQIIMVIIIIII